MRSIDGIALGNRRRDIQGLRAIAVITVVAFHAGFPVPGGFVGVDVFFVISGFVITAVLHREWEKTGGMKFGTFYLKRFKRPAPALALMVGVTLMISTVIFSPFGHQTYAAVTGIGAILMSANLVIAKTTGGYFGRTAENNPLLNTWSLSVEEQFYLVFPALIVLGWYLAKRRGLLRFSLTLIVGGVAIASFALTMAGTAALAEQPNIKSIRLVGLNELPGYAKHLTGHPKITLGGEGQTDIMWYPNQIDQRVDISQARKLGKRVITTYLDLIAYDIPKYHASPESWAAYRAMQRKIALSVDGITTISKDVAKRLYQETPGLDPKRIQAIPLGLDHISVETKSEKPKNFNPTKPFILVLGNDFTHKNRDFAIKVWQELLNQGHSIDLVLAGLHVKSSSSKAAEQELASKHVNLRGTITTMGHVTSEERTWLLNNAAAVLYPSSAEGFGFVPYEAAALNTPTAFAAFGPLKEVSQLSDLPKAWNSQQFAIDLANLITSQQTYESRVNQVQQRSCELTWRHFATQLSAFFTKIADMPLAPTAALGANSTAESAALAQVLGSKSWKITALLRKIIRS